jgi:hypothetical protein
MVQMIAKQRKSLAIIFDEDDETRREMNRWFSAKGDIRRDAAIFEAMFGLTQSRGVRSVSMPEEILGCPHEEGVDYAEGESCPQCPFWAGRERPLDTLGEATPISKSRVTRESDGRVGA